MVLSALAAGAAGGGLQTSSSSSASGGTSGSGENVIAVGGSIPNLESIINAVQGGGSSRTGGDYVNQPTYLKPAGSDTGFGVTIPGFNAGFNVSPVLIVGAAAMVFVIPLLLRRR